MLFIGSGSQHLWDGKRHGMIEIAKGPARQTNPLAATSLPVGGRPRVFVLLFLLGGTIGNRLAFGNQLLIFLVLRLKLSGLLGCFLRPLLLLNELVGLSLLREFGLSLFVLGPLNLDPSRIDGECPLESHCKGPGRIFRFQFTFELLERLVRFHLLDNVYALNYTFFPKEAIENARLTAIVDDVESARISLRFEGATRAAIKGDKAIGFAPKLLGKASWSLEQERFTAFELVAVGERWGLGSCNRRSNPKPAPMGIVFTLAGDRPADRLPPAFLSRYGW